MVDVQQQRSEHESQRPANVAAFFDVDHTLIDVNSGRKWLEYLWRHRQISIPNALRSVMWLAKYRLSMLDYEDVTRRVTQLYAGSSVRDLQDEVNRWFQAEIIPTVCRQARERVESHRKQGHTLVMLTSGTRFSTEPLRHLLDIPHLLCTEVDEAEGTLTGTYTAPACYGPGKVHWAEKFAAQHGIDLARSFFYSDSYSDLPMLERVGQPRVVNPDPRLKRRAISNGWGYEIWKSA